MRFGLREESGGYLQKTAAFRPLSRSSRRLRRRRRAGALDAAAHQREWRESECASAETPQGCRRSRGAGFRSRAASFRSFGVKPPGARSQVSNAAPDFRRLLLRGFRKDHFPSSSIGDPFTRGRIDMVVDIQSQQQAAARMASSSGRSAIDAAFAGTLIVAVIVAHANEIKHRENRLRGQLARAATAHLLVEDRPIS